MIPKHLLSFAVSTLVCSAGLVTVARIPNAAPAAAPASTGALGDFLWGLGLSGVWVSDVAPQGFPALQAVTCFHADGTYTTAQSTDFTPGDFSTMINGAWDRTGARKIRLRDLHMNFDSANAHQYWFRSTFDMDFAHDLRSATYTGTTDLFLAAQDPLDPNAQPIFSIPFTGTTRRMQVQ